MTRCTCWRPTDHPLPDCPRGREEAAERAREREASDRLLRDLERVYGDRLVDWTEAEKRLAWGDR